MKKLSKNSDISKSDFKKDIKSKKGFMNPLKKIVKKEDSNKK
jgi:hypothetical protein